MTTPCCASEVSLIVFIQREGGAQLVWTCPLCRARCVLKD